MNNTQKIGIGVVVVGLLSFAVYKQAKKDASLGTATPDTSSASLPEIKGTDDVDKIEVVNADKTDVVLEKKGDKWQVTKPVDFPANQTNVKSLVDSLKELKATEVIDPAPTDEIKKTYQLDPAHAVHVMAWKGADKKVDDSFGKSGGRGQMVMVGDKPGVYAATGYSSYLYNREVKGWRDNEIFKFDDANVVQVTIDKAAGVAMTGADAGAKKSEAGTLSFTKNGDKWSGTWKGAAIPRLDEGKIKDALRAFKNLTGDDFADGKTAADTGLDHPDSTVTITLKDNAGKYVLKVGKTGTGTTRYVQKDGSDTIYTISSFTADWALADEAKFQEAADAGAKKDSGPKTASTK